MYLQTHTKKKDGSFVTPKAKQVYESYEELKSKDTNANSKELLLEAAGGHKRGGKVSGFGSASDYYFPSTSTTEVPSQPSYDDTVWKHRLAEVEKAHKELIESNKELIQSNKELIQFKESASVIIEKMQRSMNMCQQSPQGTFTNVFPSQSMHHSSIMGFLPHQQPSYINVLPQQSQFGPFMSMLMPQTSQLFNTKNNGPNQEDNGCQDEEDEHV
ncbi:unnamed protein product [Cuscuta epithymum]|uniref:Uncharacterized protein n=1 Tax=Cuscuta epithymum TaxID=186058 RepID=A0AAV0FWX4_9ASTE|nr:unnamed protein product [Cuscuta epithymum]